MSLADPSPTATAHETFLERARGTLAANDTGAFIEPTLHQSPQQWSWDAALVAIGLAHLDESYDPRYGTPAGASDPSWSAALALEMLEPLPVGA